MTEDTEGYHPPQSLAALHPHHLLSCTTWSAHLAISSMEPLTLLSITSPLPWVLKERDTSFRPQTDMDGTNTTRSVTANQSTSVIVAQLAEDGKRIKETFKNSQTPKHQKCFCIPVEHLHQQLKTSLLHLPPTTSPSPWCVCKEEVSCHSFCLPEVVSVPSVPSTLQISQQLPEELSERTGSVMRNSLCSHSAGKPLSTTVHPVLIRFNRRGWRKG